MVDLSCACIIDVTDVGRKTDGTVVTSTTEDRTAVHKKKKKKLEL
jgi:hypothetical protein